MKINRTYDLALQRFNRRHCANHRSVLTAQAFELCERLRERERAAAAELLEACKLAIERLKPKNDVKKYYHEWVAYAALGKAIHTAEN